MKTADHFWTDPSADELVQRHRIHGGHCRQDSPTKRPALCVSLKTSNTAEDHADNECQGLSVVWPVHIVLIYSGALAGRQAGRQGLSI